MEHLFVQGSRAPVAGGFYLQGNSNITMHNVTVLDSQCTLTGCWGGAIVPESHTTLLITDSAFIECMAPQGFGGAIDDGTVANWTVRNTLFLRNRATYGGAVYNFGSTTSYFYNCSFIDNIADNNGGGVKTSSNTYTYFEGCLFQGNRASSNAAMGPASDCTATRTYCTVVKDTTFRGNYAASIAGGLAVVSNVWLENVLFEDNWSLDVAGGLYLYLPQTTYLSNLTFINNTAPNGGAMFIEGLTEFEFNGPVKLINNSARYIQLAGEATGIGGGFGVQGLTQVRFKGPVTLLGGSAANGGGASIAGAATVVFEDAVIFEDNHAVNGGGMFVGSSATVNLTRGATFRKNSATSYGGAIYHDGASSLYAPDVLIQYNQARYGAGYASGISLQECPDLEDAVFESNSASTVGGALYVAVTSVQCACVNCTLIGNTAPTGSGITGAPASVVPTDVIPSSVTASEEFSASFVLNDVYGAQSAAQDRVVTATVTSFTLPDGTTLSRDTQVVSLRGPSVAYFVANTASFGVLKLSGPPGSSAEITFDASPAVDHPYVVQMTIKPCDSDSVEMEIDGTYYCLKANRVSKATRIAITVIAAICILLGLLVLIWLIYHRNKAAIRKSSVLFCILTTIGAIFMFVAAIMWVFVSDATCALRIWLLVTGFVLCYGSIFVKEYRLWLIFDETDIMRTVRVTDGLLLKVVFGGLAIELLVTMIWFIVTPFLKRVTVDLVKEEISYRCTSTLTPAFFWILFALNMVILLIGCILAWLARNVPANFNEAKQILFSIYNVTLTSIIVVVLGNVFRTTSEAISLTVAIGLMFSSVVTLLILFVPKIRHVADKEAVKRAILKEIAGLERDIAWKKRMLSEVDSTYKDSKTATASRKQRTATGSGSASAH
jgi:predicted outer membrane repeat protein